MNKYEHMISEFKKSIEEYRKALAEGKNVDPKKYIEFLSKEIEAMNSMRDTYQEGMNLIIEDMKNLGTGR
ncbi:hypothetical protein HKK70_08885 [Bacillus safensis]|uniref:hypothetical protein n=1 Tax=Bacillus safensis TaxID=561879 RepID=UPI00146C3343|nr:hypothetical protein [Bacillus safensis]MCM3365993.1 hypothetical protein [Bacillus safensis]NMW01880.1 hypothetical protein [Bacillus safensis]